MQCHDAKCLPNCLHFKTNEKLLTLQLQKVPISFIPLQTPIGRIVRSMKNFPQSMNSKISQKRSDHTPSAWPKKYAYELEPSRSPACQISFLASKKMPTEVKIKMASKRKHAVLFGNFDFYFSNFSSINYFYDELIVAKLKFSDFFRFFLKILKYFLVFCQRFFVQQSNHFGFFTHSII